MVGAWSRMALTGGGSRRVAPLCGVLMLACGAILVAQGAGTGAGAPTVARLPFTPEPPVLSYVAIRRFESANVRHRKEAWLVARTELKDGDTFSWQVLEEGGSELIRKRVLRAALEKEEQVHRDGRARRGGLTADNYVFSAPTSVDGELRVLIEPRRREDMLVKGSLVMAPTGELLRVEGQLVKRPSFWTRSVRLVRHYGRVEGTHVPVRLDMDAQVLIVGASRLSMTYRYLEINGRPVHDDGQAVATLTRTAGGTRPPAAR